MLDFFFLFFLGRINFINIHEYILTTEILYRMHWKLQTSRAIAYAPESHYPAGALIQSVLTLLSTCFATLSRMRGQVLFWFL